MAIVRARIINLICSYCIRGNRLSTKMSYGVDRALIANDPQTLLDAWVAAVFPAWQAAVSTEVSFQMCYAYADAPGTCIPNQQPFVSEAGSVVGNSLPGNIPVVVQIRQTEVPGRHNGRMFVSGISEADVTDSLITTAVLGTHWVDLTAALLTPLAMGGGGNAYLGVVVRTLSGSPVTPSLMVANQVYVTRALASLRKRTTEEREVHA